MADIENGQREDRCVGLGLAVKEFEEFFYQSSRGNLYKFVLEAIEKPLIESVLDHTDGNQCKAARVLGINRNTLHTKIRKLGIDASRWKR